MIALFNSLRALQHRPLLGYPGGPAAGIGHAAAWQASLQGLTPIQACRVIVERIDMLGAARTPPEEFARAVVAAHDAFGPILTRIDAALPRGDMRLGQSDAQLVHGTLTLLKRLSLTMLALAQKLSGHWFLRSASHTVDELLQHGANAVLQRVELAHRVYARSSDRCWGQFASFTELSLARGAPRPPQDGSRPDGLHARALLLVLADPNRLGPRDFGHLRAFLRRHGTLGRVCRYRDIPEAQRSDVGLHALGTSGRRSVPLRALRGLVIANQTLVLDARPLLARLDRQLDGLDAGVDPARLGLPPEARDASFRAFLEHLRARWSEARPRRHSRIRFLPRARLATGFADARDFVLRGVRPGVEPDRGANWSVADESPGGICLAQRAVRPDAAKVGEICCVHADGFHEIHAGVIRRIEMRGSRTCRIGIELLGNGPRAVTVHDPLAGEHGRTPIPGLMLGQVPALQGRPALICVAGLLRSDHTVLVETGREATVHTVLAVERLSDDADLATLSPPG